MSLFLRLTCLMGGCWLAAAIAAEPPPLLLAKVYDETVPLQAYWISEKLDGVRGYWDGRRLLTRGGHVIQAPDWFTAGWPDIPMDGELWSGRGRFAQISGTVRAASPDDAAWRALRFMVFDLPSHPGVFDERLAELRRRLGALDIAWLQPVAQFRIDDADALQARLDAVVSAGGEGLMLHRADSHYHAGRSDDLLKLKPYDDAEARVIAHLPGQGRYEGQLGSLLVERPDGLRFRLGTGFSDEERRDPPAIGRWVTYRYNGLTVNGVPRFARFLRIREALPPPDPPIEP